MPNGDHDRLPDFTGLEDEAFFNIMYRSYTVHQSAVLDRIALGLEA